MTHVDIRDTEKDLTNRMPIGAVPAVPGRPRGALVVCPSLLVREGMIRLLERVGGAGSIHAASSMEFAVQLHRSLRPAFTWVHEEADPRFSFARLFVESRGGGLLAVLLRPSAQAWERAAVALQAGAFAAFDASCPTDQMLEGLRGAVQGTTYLAGPLRRNGVYRDPAWTPHGAGGGILTERESQVLTLMAEGLSNQKIAEILVISVETVRTHTKTTMRKLGAQSRADAVARGFRLRILMPENFSELGPMAPRPPMRTVPPSVSGQ